MLVGCSPEECHYEFGSRRAAELFEEVRKLAGMLGFRRDQLAFHQIRAGEPRALVDKVRAFVSQLTTAPAGAGPPPVSSSKVTTRPPGPRALAGTKPGEAGP
jgi:coenzyme F420-reducing hydrogenase delta subunit